jgi:spore coat protein A
MGQSVRRGWVAGMALAIAAAGYAAAPLAFASGQAGVVLGHVPTSDTPLAGAVVVGPGGAVTGYDTTFVNLDEIAHTVTSVGRKADGSPLFSGNALPGTTAPVVGTDKLAPGTYAFYCQFHPNMQGTLIVEGTDNSGTKPAAPSFRQPLVLPKVLTGSHLTIPVKEANVRVLPSGPKTLMWTFGGSYPGPTIRRPAGHRTTVTYVDKLPRAVGPLTIHLHGDHHASASDGLPDSHLLDPGKKRTYTYPLTDGGKPEPAAFDFYHDHRMGETGRDVWNGLQGMFITSDRLEQKLKLPTGRYDVPLDVADRSFDGANQLTEPFPHPGDGETSTSKFSGPYAPPGDSTVGDHILVDGRFAPYLDVSTHRYRLRLLNGSDFQSYDFHLSTGAPFVQIGTGSALLPKPVVRTDILLGPAQRADVIVDFSKSLHKKIVLESEARQDSQPGGIGTPTAPIMQFRVTKKVADHSRIPAKLRPLPALNAPSTPDMVWTFGLGGDATTGSYWTVNGHRYDPTRVDAEITLGSTQTWLLQNLSPITHYIHIHEEQWRTMLRDGQAPPAYENGYVDTWRLDPGESVEVAAKFTDYTGVFMIHCHMLDHEDHGMMAQFDVVKKSSDLLPQGYHFGPSASAPVGMGDMGGAARTAMAQMGSMSLVAAIAPGWMHVVVRLGWAVSVELPALALSLLWRRRRTLDAVRRRAFVILMLAGVALTHTSDWPDKLYQAPYLAVGFGLLVAGSGAAAVATATIRRPAVLREVDNATAIVSALTIAGYLVSRSSIGLPEIHNHIDHWRDPWGVASLVVEAALVCHAGRKYLPRRLPRINRGSAHMSRPRWVVAMVASFAAVAALFTGLPSQAATKGHVLLVCNGTKKCPHVKGAHYYKSLQLAVDHATNGDWILVWPGKYSESVTVQAGRGLTGNLHIRGMNRNGVLFDGKKTGGSAVHVLGVNNTWVENMTGENYTSGAANAFYWTGVDGYWGNYLTAYNNGDYGIYAYDSTSSGKLPATLAHDYASWNADSGIYIGGCRDCNAVIVDSQAEKNAIGYSGTNAGGELYLLNSEWDHNASGIVPNTLTSEPDPPQEGVNIIGNYVHDNNDSDVPGSGITAIAPVGNGIEIAGGSSDIIRGNLIKNEKHDGVILHWLFTPPIDDQILYNTFVHAGYAGQPGDADIGIDGTSLQACVDHNVDRTGGKKKPATVDPPDVNNLDTCGDENPLRQQGRGIYEPGDPVVSIMTALNAAGITEPKDYKGPGPKPGAKHTMPNPCKGVPDNPWCSRGKLKFKAPGSP